MASDLAEPVHPAYLEMTTLTIPDTLRAAIAAGATRIVVVPRRRTHGDARPDVPRLLAEIATAAR